MIKIIEQTNGIVNIVKNKTLPHILFVLKILLFLYLLITQYSKDHANNIILIAIAIIFAPFVHLHWKTNMLQSIFICAPSQLLKKTTQHFNRSFKSTVIFLRLTPPEKPVRSTIALPRSPNIYLAPNQGVRYQYTLLLIMTYFNKPNHETGVVIGHMHSKYGDSIMNIHDIQCTNNGSWINQSLLLPCRFS